MALNLASTVPDWLANLGGRPMVLGLDLQGGVHFVLQVDQKAALDKRLDAYTEDVRSTLRDARIAYQSVERRADNSIVANLSPSAGDDAAQRARAALVKAQPTLGYDVSGNRITVTVPETEIAQIANGAIEQNINTLRNRVNQLGVAEPIIQRQGADRVVVQLPGVQDTAEAKRMIGATATLEYRAVVEGNAQDAIDSGRIPPEAKVYQRRDGGGPILLNKRDRHRRPDGRRAGGDRLHQRCPGGQRDAEQRRRPAHVRLHQRQREQADGGGVHRTRADRDHG